MAIYVGKHKEEQRCGCFIYHWLLSLNNSKSFKYKLKEIYKLLSELGNNRYSF